MPLLLLALGLAAAPIADERTLDRMVLCQAYHEQWQWDLHHAGEKVYKDGDWFVGFHRRLLAAAEAAGINYEQVAIRNNRLVDGMRAGLTPEQLADWKKCQAEFGWQHDASGETYDL